jgi:hypothetical protein
MRFVAKSSMPPSMLAPDILPRSEQTVGDIKRMMRPDSTAASARICPRLEMSAALDATIREVDVPPAIFA